MSSSPARRCRGCSSASASTARTRSSSETASRSSVPATGRSSSSAATASSSRAPLPADSRLYLITPVRPDLEAFLRAAVRGGVDMVQIREKEMPDRELLAALEQARAVTRRLGVPVAAARRFGVGVGLSTHAPDEIDAAEAEYIGVGPVYATPTKAGRPAVGLELVRYAAAHARLPWFAIGGIDA